MKSLFASKTFWVNVFAVLGMGAQAFTGTSVLMNPEAQATLLAVVNIALRMVTKDAVSLTG